MNDDTHPSVRARYTELLMQKSGEERLLMGCSMFDAAKQIVMDSIRNEHPDLTPARMRQMLFLRFYGADYNEEQEAKILQALARER